VEVASIESEIVFSLGPTRSEGKGTLTWPQLPPITWTDAVALIGAITGVPSLVITLIRLRRERVNLVLEPRRCTHHLSKNRAGGASVSVGVCVQLDVEVNNRGNWDTTVNDVKLKCTDYQSPKEKLKAGGVRIPRHDTKPLEHTFFIPGKETASPTMKCTLTLYHTHGHKSFDVTTSIRGR